MNEIKKTNKTRLFINLPMVLFAVVTFGLAFVALTPQVSAAKAKCLQKRLPIAENLLVDCNDPNAGFAQKAKAQGLTFEDDKCYELVVFGTGTVVGFADCNDPRFAGESKTKDPKEGIKRDDEAVIKGCGQDDPCGIYVKYINPAIKLFSGAIGLIVTIMIIVGGIQYSSAEGDPQKVAAAKTRIFNAILAFVAFILLFAVLNWLVPGNLI